MSGAADGRPEDDPAAAPDEAGGTPGEKAADDDIDASLHLALSDLERMLDSREGSAAARRAGPGGRTESEDDGEQYTIPLLDEVVIPGPTQAVPPPSPQAGREPEPLADDEPSVRARIAARIASEVDVIVQDRIEEALEQARDEIRRRVRDHMDIILPEIVEELVQARRRHGRS